MPLHPDIQDSITEGWKSGLIQTIAAIIAALWGWFSGLFSKLWVKFKAWRVCRKELAHNRELMYTALPAALKQLDSLPVLAEKVSKIEYQVAPNGGGSMIDAINRIEVQARAHTETLAAQDQALGAIRGDLAIAKALSQFQVDNATDGMFECDATGRNTYVSRRYCSLLGRSEHDLLSLEYRTLIHPSERDAYMREALQCINDRSVFRRRVRLQHADGQYLLFEVVVQPYPQAPEPLLKLFGKLTLVVH